MFEDALKEEAQALLHAAEARGATLATAESCTGGLIAALLTELPGSSKAFVAGLTTYSNAAKTALLGVDPALIADNGAVSEPVARAMAEGALARTGADVAVSVTGIAGPGGGAPGKPVGLVHFACAARGADAEAAERRFGDLGRERVRLESVRAALALLARGLERLGG